MPYDQTCKIVSNLMEGFAFDMVILAMAILGIGGFLIWQGVVRLRAERPGVPLHAYVLVAWAISLAFFIVVKEASNYRFANDLQKECASTDS